MSRIWHSALGTRHSPRWPRIYAACAVFGFLLGLLVIGPAVCAPRRLPEIGRLDVQFSLHLGH